MSPRLRWLTLATHVPANGSGGGMIRVAVEFIRAAAKRIDLEQHVLCRGEAADYFAQLLGDASRVHVVPGPSHVMSMSSYEQFVLPLAGRRFDVIHGTKHLLPLRMPFGNRPTLVLTVHDMIFLDRPGDFPGLKGTLLREPYLASVRMADVLACNSDATRDRLLSYVPSAASRTVVVPLAVPESLRNATPEPVSELVGRRFALVVGDDSSRKNLATLLHAMTAVRARDPEAVLVILGGRNWGETAAAEELRRATDDGRAIALGFRSDGELRWCYEHAAVVCCPSALEGYGLPAVEARTFGRPLITSDDRALTEVSGEQAVHVGSQVAGEWVEPLLSGLRGALPATEPPADWTWDDFVATTVAATVARRAND